MSLVIAADGATSDEFFRYGVPSLLSMPRTGVIKRAHSGDNKGGSHLTDDWQTTLTKFAGDFALPRLRNGSAIGVFVVSLTNVPCVSCISGHGFVGRRVTRSAVTTALAGTVS